MSEPGAGRRAEIAANLAGLRDRITAACAAAARPPGDITLIAVTKTFPVSDVVALRELGQADVGENRDQEAAPKAAACAALGLTLAWHFVGQLQANKAASVVSYAALVHSVDRPALVSALGRRAVAAGRDAPGRELACLVQVSLDRAADEDAGHGPAARGGAAPGDVLALAD